MEQTKLHAAVAALAVLRDGKESKCDYLGRLQNGVIQALKNVNVDEDLKKKLRSTDHITMKFIFVSLHVLKQLAVNTKDDSVQILISIQQQQRIKVLLQLIFSLGVLPSLVQGVDIPLANKTVQLGLFNLGNWSLPESYFIMHEVVIALLEILKSPNLRSLILVHLGDLMAALLQLINIGDIKKPPKCNFHPQDKEKKFPFIINEDWYENLVRERLKFKEAYEDLVGHIYKPLVIKELLILLTPLCSAHDDGKHLVPPVWMKRTVSKQLSAYLTSPGGVALIMRAMCDSTSDDIDRKKVFTMAKVISTVHGCYSCDEFYGSIGPQIIGLLNTTGAYCVPVARQCIKNIYEQNIDICHKYIFDKLFEPFIICSKTVNENFNGTLISEESLARCIEHLETCFTPEIRDATLPISALLKIIKIQFKLYCKVLISPYQYISVIQDLLMRFFNETTDLQELALIYNCLLFDEKHPDILEMNESLKFEFGPSGGIQVAKPEIDSQSTDIKSEVAGDCLLYLFSQNEGTGKNAMYDLFVILLRSLMNSCYDEVTLEGDSKKDLLDTDDILVYVVQKSQKKLITIKLIACLSENVWIMDSIQEDPDIVIKFLVNFLEKKAKDIVENQSNKEDSENLEKEEEEEGNFEDLLVSLGILDILTMNLRTNSEKWYEYNDVLKSLKMITECCKDFVVQSLATQLMERIMTHGVIQKNKKPIKRLDKYASIMDVVSETLSNIKVEEKDIKLKIKNECSKKIKTPLVEEKSSKTNTENSELDKIIDMLCDTDIPTRGHGLIRLKGLINKKDPNIISSKTYIFSVLKENLKHEDSFIYLAAINGLEALSNLYPDMVIDILTKEFLENKKHCHEMLMKIGEVLVKVSKNLGEMAPKYKNILVNTFLIGAKDPSEYIRASSLSNLGEILKILGYCVGPILNEIFECIHSIANTDSCDLARRAAVMVAHLLLQGVSVSTFMVIEPIIRELYRSLNHIYKTDKDESTRLHAQLAIDEIDRLVRSVFQKKSEKLEKRIYVLDFPR